MMIDTVDSYDHPIGTIEREHVFMLNKNFRVIHIIVFDASGGILLQKLPDEQPRHPGRWGSSVAGYLQAGESYEVAAKRKLWEELGVKRAQLSWFGKSEMTDNGCQKFIGIYTTDYSGPFFPDLNHIADLKIFSLDQIDILRSVSPTTFTPTFLHVYDFWQKNRQAQEASSLI